MTEDTKTFKKSSALSEVIVRDYTIHLHKYLHSTSFKKRAPKAMKVIKEFAQKMMKTTDVRLDPALNKAVWTNGIKSVPHRIRVRLDRKRNDVQDAKEKMYTHVTVVPVASFKGLQTETVDQ